MNHVQNWIHLLPTLADEEEYNNIVENMLYILGLFAEMLSLELKERLIYALLVYEAQYQQNLTSYELIMKVNVDLGEKFPTDVPVVNEKNLKEIIGFKNSSKKMKMIFTKMLDRLQPNEIQIVHTSERDQQQQQQV
jgi:2-phosphoglycerate kinase